MTMSINGKYGTEFIEPQVDGNCEYLHREIHKLLYSREEEDSNLDTYFKKLQCKLGGMNEMFYHQPELITLMSVIESARIEASKPDYNHETYRTLIFDAHSILDRLFERKVQYDNLPG